MTKKTLIIFVVIGIILTSGCIQQEQPKEEWVDLKKEIPSIVLLADEGTYQQLEIEINRFAQDITNDVGTEVRIFHQNYRDVKEIKNSLLGIKQELDFGGIILIGEIPISLVTTESLFIMARAPSPSDSYYADLENTYEYEEKTDSEGNVYFHIKQPNGFKSGDIKRWVGRITAPIEADNKIQLIKDYLNRNHEYRTGKINYNNEILVFLPDDFGCRTLGLDECIGGTKETIAETYFFDADSVRPLVYGQGDNTFLKQTYLNEIKKPYSAVLMNAHGLSDWHSPDVWYSDIKTSSHQSMFFELLSCSNGAFNSEHNIAQWYLFSGKGLVVKAHSVPILAMSVARGRLLLPNMRTLAVGGRIYEAYPTKNYQALLGDPTLKIKKIDTACNLVFSNDSIDFGTESLSYPYAPKGMRILQMKNIGNEKCTISLVESYPSTYIQGLSWLSKEILPQESVNLSLSIRGLSRNEIESPNRIADRSGYLRIISNDPENIVKISFQGKINRID